MRFLIVTTILIVIYTLIAYSMSLNIVKKERNYSITCYSGSRIFFADNFTNNPNLNNNGYITYEKDKTLIKVKGDCLLTGEY